MKRHTFWGIMACVFSFFVAEVEAQSVSFDTVTDGIDSLTEQLASSLPTTNMTGAAWSDAYIGSILPIPHFGVGITAGLVTVPYKGFDPLLKAIGSSLPKGLEGLGLVIPAYTVNARIGGIILPVDFGARIGLIPPGTIKGNVSVDYSMVAGDFRYAVLEENLIIPGVSLGFGVNYLRTSIGLPLDIGATKSFAVGGNTLGITSPQFDFNFESWEFEFSAQVSKSFLLFVPYLGTKMGINNVNSKASLSTTMTFNGSPIDQAAVKTLNQMTKASFRLLGWEKAVNKNGAMRYTIFGGVSLNILLIKLDLQAFYNLGLGNMGATLGARFQL